MHVTLAQSSSRDEGLREHNGTAIQKIAFLIAFARYTILSRKVQTGGTLAAPNLQGVTRTCMNHPSHRERQSSLSPKPRTPRGDWCSYNNLFVRVFINSMGGKSVPFTWPVGDVILALHLHLAAPFAQL